MNLEEEAKKLMSMSKLITGIKSIHIDVVDNGYILTYKGMTKEDKIECKKEIHKQVDNLDESILTCTQAGFVLHQVNSLKSLFIIL